MNAKNALGFLVVGVLMKSLPGMIPDWFPPTGADGTNASAIWLTWMGRIEIFIGSWYLIKHQTALALKRLAAPKPRRERTASVSFAGAQPRVF